ncbi:MAG: hypothetical protein ACLFU9_06055 [Candidatus Bathyarchaeia archaeon]
MNPNLSETLQNLLFITALAISLFITFTYLFSMGLGIAVFFATPEGTKFSQDTIILQILLTADVEITINAGLYFLFIWWIFAICFIAAWKYRESLSSKVKELLPDSPKNSFGNNLIAMPIITSMLLVATIILHYLQTQTGIPTGTPPQNDPFFDLLRFSHASLLEELFFRIIPIGTFLLPYILIVGKTSKLIFSWRDQLKLGILAVLQPDKAKEKVGLKTIGENGLLGGTIWAEWVMVGLTAFLFGVAHYLGGWGPGKISQAAMSGLVFALAYLYYGIQAPILLHWYFNYYFVVFDLSLEYYSMLTSLSYLAWAANLFLGFLMWFTVITLGLMAILKLQRKRISF